MIPNARLRDPSAVRLPDLSPPLARTRAGLRLPQP